MAMRSGPSTRATSCGTRRQRKRTGGPSGTSAIASIGFGPLEQADRAAWARGYPARHSSHSGGDWLVPCRMRRHGGDGEFRNMRVARLQPADAAQAEARAQAVDQMREIGG